MSSKPYKLHKMTRLGKAGGQLCEQIKQSRSLRRTLKGNETTWEAQLRRLIGACEWGVTPGGLWVRYDQEGLEIGAQPPQSLRSAALFSDPLEEG